MPNLSARAQWNTANAKKANSMLDGFRGSQEIANSLRPYTPIIQWGAVSQKWHVTFADWTNEVYTGNTILEALEAAEQGVHLTGGILPDLQASSTPKPDPNLKADTIPPTSK
jgi:predicted RNase H-like HicB family nuclease